MDYTYLTSTNLNTYITQFIKPLTFTSKPNDEVSKPNSGFAVSWLNKDSFQ